MRRQVNGILLLDKPAGLTSNGALQRVKRLFFAKKVGHTGSLDPIATGMLPLCFGEATKFSQFLLDSNKAYSVVAQLGVETTTGDSEGEVTVERPILNVTRERILEVMTSFIGEIEQIPPMFSALKHQGKPLYELARQGIEIERKPRSIRIFSMSLEAYNDTQVSFHVRCSKGTYIRTLMEDIGRALGCGAHVIKLHRTEVEPYSNATMYSLEMLEAIAESKGFEGLNECLLPVETSVQVFPAVMLSTSAAFYIKLGQSVRASFPLDAPLVRLHSEDSRFLGIGEVMTDGRVKPHRLLSTQESPLVSI